MMKKSPIEIRVEARQLAVDYAFDREACGDPEGAECMRDLANAIHSLALEKPDRREPTLAGDFLCHGKSGYGDYIILNVDGAGMISDYQRPEIDAADWEPLPKDAPHD